MISPVDHISIVQGFSDKHLGIDFGWFSINNHNQNIRSMDDGIVIYNRYQKTGGYVIHVKHNNGYVSEYGHLLENSQKVKEGDKVKKGQVIAKMGASGKVSGEHCHVGLYKGNKIDYNKPYNFVNPLKYINIYDKQEINEKSKGKIKHTKHVVDLKNPPLNIRKNNLKGKVVDTKYSNEEIENYGIKNNLLIVDNIRNYVCSALYVK